jgi:hypothetical protein
MQHRRSSTVESVHRPNRDSGSPKSSVSFFSKNNLVKITAFIKYEVVLHSKKYA